MTYYEKQIIIKIIEDDGIDQLMDFIRKNHSVYEIVEMVESLGDVDGMVDCFQETHLDYFHDEDDSFWNAMDFKFNIEREIIRRNNDD